jgi:ATP-dependent DNA helicase RecG
LYNNKVNLATSIESVKGVGPKTAEQFRLSGIETVGQLIEFLPRKHEDFSEVVTIDTITPGKRTIKARAEQVEIKRVRRGMTVTTATLVDETGKLKATWFNQPYRATQLKDGSLEFYFSGEFEFSYNRYQLTNPSAELVKDMPVQTDRLLPIYPSVKGLKSQTVRKILDELRPLITMLPETLPTWLVKEQKLMSRSDSLLGMHFPSKGEDIGHARTRLAFEELFQLILAARLNKQANSKLTSWHIPFQQAIVRRFVEALPFDLTNDQRRAAWDILQDFESETPMNRLLQGDVGSGKTVVAGLAARQAHEAGFQSALLAPTEILASQHATTLETLLKPFGVTVALLTGGVKGAKRKALLKQLKDGNIDVLVGTHALLEDPVQFSQLGFVVIDEQHRFGVRQRQALLKKSNYMPHVLTMTATPIPRSLALTVYGELDISIIATKPRNRLPIKTKIWSPVSRQQLYRAIDNEIEKGRQAYVICRLIDDSPNSDAKSVQAEYKKLQNSVFAQRRIGLLHGRMKSDEKEQVMSDFKTKKYDILVSTTVVEVGVDVPNATVILIEDADLYGLAQLHQLRGRVGRGEHQSYCFLLTSDTKKPSQRLHEIEKSNDGFYLAEVDLNLRGPGEVYGRAQHGALNLRIATLSDTKLIKQAQEAADKFIANGEDLLQYKQLAREVELYQRLTTLN